MDRGDTGGARLASTLALISGALILVLVLAFCALTVVGVTARYAALVVLFEPDVADTVQRIACFGIAAASLLALPAAVIAGFTQTGNPPLRSHSALGLVPGCLLALVIAVALFAAIVLGLGPEPRIAAGQAVNIAINALDSHVFLSVPVMIVLAAALSGARTPESTAAAAAPAVLSILVGIATENSIGKLWAAQVAPGLALALAFAGLYALAPARTLVPWHIGFALSVGLALLAGTGLLTPTEAATLIALFGIGIGVPIRTAALRQPLAPILRQAAVETSAIIVIVATSTLITINLVLGGTIEQLKGAIQSISALPWIAGAVFAVTAYLLSASFALLAVSPILVTVMQAAGLEPLWFGTIVTLLGIAAIIARSARRDPAAASLPPLAAWLGAACAIAVALVVALVPDFALDLARIFFE